MGEIANDGHLSPSLYRPGSSPLCHKLPCQLLSLFEDSPNPGALQMINVTSWKVRSGGGGGILVVGISKRSRRHRGRVFLAAPCWPADCVRVTFPIWLRPSVLRRELSRWHRRHGFDSLGWKDHLEEQMATHSSILAWRIPWTEAPGGL